MPFVTKMHLQLRDWLWENMFPVVAFSHNVSRCKEA